MFNAFQAAQSLVYALLPAVELSKAREKQILSFSIGQTAKFYTIAINREESRTASSQPSVFFVWDLINDPSPENLQYCSAGEYLGLEKQPICNLEKGRKLLRGGEVNAI